MNVVQNGTLVRQIAVRLVIMDTTQWVATDIGVSTRCKTPET